MNGLFDKIIKTDVRVFLCIGLFVLCAYSFMLASPFKTMDDDFSIVQNADIRDLRHVPDLFRSTYFKSDKDYYRPLVYVTYALEYRAFGLNYFYYNLDNVALHIINAFLVFLLAGLLLCERRMAFFTAFLFAIHPIHWEAVGNISGRAILLCAFFTLGGFIFFLKFVRERKIGLLVLSLVCYILGLLSKESAGVLILAVACLWWIVERKGFRQSLILVPFAGVAFGYLLLRHALGIVKMFPWPSWGELGLGLASFLAGILTYLRLLLLPVGLHFDRAQPVYKSVADPFLWVTLAIYAVALWGAIRFWRKIPALILFCLVWFFIELLPVSQIVTTIGVYPGAISLAEHFVYVACIPVLILMVRAAEAAACAAVARRLLSWGAVRFAFAGFILFFFLTLVQQALYASNEFVMLRDSLAKAPQNARLQYSMGMIYVKTRDFAQAVDHFRRAAEADPGNQGYRIAVGKALADGGDFLGAVREYEKVPPGSSLADLLKANKTAAYRALVGQYETRTRQSAAKAEDLFALGVFYSKLDRSGEAREAFEAVWQKDRGHFDALFNVAVISEALKDWPRARAAYETLAGEGGSANAFQKPAAERLSYIDTQMGGDKKSSGQ